MSSEKIPPKSIAEVISEQAKMIEQNKDQPDLDPIREKISRLEDGKNYLTIIANSIKPKVNEDNGPGMREFPKLIDENLNEIRDLMEKNKDTLEQMGITNEEELASHQAFVGAKGTEWISAKNLINEADNELLEKLILDIDGVQFNPETFSYDAIEKALAEKIKEYFQELI